VFNKPAAPNKLWQYRHLLLRYKPELIGGVVALVLTNLLSISVPWLVKLAVDTLQQEELLHQHNREGLYTYLLAILGVSLAMLVIRIVSRQLLLGIGRKMEYDLRNKLYGHLLTMPPSYFLANPTGELMSRLTNDVTAIRYLTGGGIMLGINTLLAYCTTFPMMALISPRLTLYAFLLFPLGIYIMRRLSGLVKQHYYTVQDVLGDISTVAQENLSGIGVIQSYAKEPVEARRFNQVCTSYYTSYVKMVKCRIWLFLVMAMVSGLSLLVVLTEGGREVITGQLDLGGFIAFTLYLERLAWPTMALGWALSTFQQGAASIDRIDEVLSTRSTLAEPTAQPVPEDWQPHTLRFENVTFQFQNPYGSPHHDNSQKPALLPSEVPQESWGLQEITLEIPSGTTVAVVGPVGSGKSTLLSLVPRLLEVGEGQVFLGDLDITRLPLETLRATIAFMPQHSFLFSSTVTKNIAYGRPEASQSLVESFAQLAQLHEEVGQFEHQYQTIVGERGVILSGGQRQRVSLARTLMVEKPVLILDDPFSHLDAETEQTILETLAERKTFQNKITLFATHRFSLVQQADWVVLMDAGRVVDVGPHEALLTRQPLYRKLNRLERLRQEIQAHNLQDWLSEEEADAATHASAQVSQERSR
jgi:ATP-binding cassette subfamily B protein